MFRSQILLTCILLPIMAFGQLPEINEVTLTFTAPDSTETIVTASAESATLEPDSSLVFLESTEYQLAIHLADSMGDVTAQFAAEGNNLQFFFSDTNGIFAIAGAYLDTAANGLSVGFNSAWTTACATETLLGDLRIVLSDLTGIKTDSSSITDGDAIFDLTWPAAVNDDPDAPECENEEEIIDKVTLTFTPTAGGDPIVAVASDPDGPGPLDLMTEDIALLESTDYELTLTLENTIEGEDITEEIREEDGDHLFLFGIVGEAFEDPEGDGNIDNRTDPINYNDQDGNGLPLGLSTSWTTACFHEEGQSGSLRVVLKHQPGIKSQTSGFEDGGTDVDISWNVSLVDDPDAPACENEEDIIDKVTLTFTPTAGGDPIVAVASDPDGPGPLDLMTEDIALLESTDYELTLTLENTIEGEDITEEIREEADDHQFFFAWSGDVFTNPEGDGNVDVATDPVTYTDQDGNGLPIGLSTMWTTNVDMSAGTLRVVLKHQPGLKSVSSTVEDGGTDLDITWTISALATSSRNLDPHQSLTIAPNPARGHFQLLATNLELKSLTATLLDISGRTIARLNDLTRPIDVQHLPAGLFQLRIQGPSFVTTRRLNKL